MSAKILPFTIRDDMPRNPTPCANCRSREGMMATVMLVGALGWVIALVTLVLLCVQKGILD